MLMRRMTRTGITLTEVLVALFIMAIGMIALLVMFPLGAQQIAQAIKDERSAQAANNADNIIRDHWRKYVVEYLKRGGTESDLVNPASPDFIHYMSAMENPNQYHALPALNRQLANDIIPTNIVPDRTGMVPLITYDAATGNNWTTTPVNASKPSYPVFISPYQEYVRRGGNFQQSRRWVAGVRPSDNNGTAPSVFNVNNQARIPRRTLNFPQTTPVVYETQNIGWQFRMCTLMDDIDFDEDGNAYQGTTVTRSGRYNWDWVVQRPAQGNRLTMNLSVIVYDQRPFNTRRPDDEVVYNIPIAPAAAAIRFGAESIRIPYNTNNTPPTTIPSIRAGQWIMDGTIYTDPTNVNSFRNANFYRVTAVTDVPGAIVGQGAIQVDLQTPLKIPAGTTFTDGMAYPVQAQIYVLRGVAEVLERRPLTNDDAPVVP